MQGMRSEFHGMYEYACFMDVSMCNSKKVCASKLFQEEPLRAVPEAKVAPKPKAKGSPKMKPSSPPHRCSAVNSPEDISG